MGFLLTCLLRGMTILPVYKSIVIAFLLTCLLRGMTTRFFVKKLIICWFLLTCLLRGMTELHHYKIQSWKFLLTCLLRGMTSLCSCACMVLSISTHMPLARHDSNQNQCRYNIGYFYSHASCEAWPFFLSYKIVNLTFLLTCLLRGMTLQDFHDMYYSAFLLTCLLRGMTISSLI